MSVRAVEGKLPYTGGVAIDIDENKVISLRLRDENNLIIWDQGDNEIYVDLQLNNELRPTSAFPVGVTTGRVIVDNGWDVTGTIICAKTTSGDNIKLLYGDNGKLYIDNGTGTFKQIYLKGEVDALLQALRDYVDTELAKKGDTKTFHLSGTGQTAEVLAEAQEIYDWYSLGKTAIVEYQGDNFYLSSANQWFVTFQKIWFNPYRSNATSTTRENQLIHLAMADGEVTEVMYGNTGTSYTTVDGQDLLDNGYLEVYYDYPEPYTPKYNGSPATKIYVDNNVLARVDSSTPSNPLTGQLWYDTANSVLKVYDGTAWQTV